MPVNSKDRRTNGYYTPDSTVPITDLKDNDLIINPEYNDWQDYRDGMRDWFSDNTLISHLPIKYLEMTESGQFKLKIIDKLKRDEQIRKARKTARNALYSDCRFDLC